jgi:hypothetical protein
MLEKKKLTWSRRHGCYVLEKKKKTNTPESSKALGKSKHRKCNRILPSCNKEFQQQHGKQNEKETLENTRAPNPNSSSTLRPRP